MSGKKIGARRQERQLSLCFCVSVPPTCPRGDGGPRQGGTSRREERNDLGAGSTGCHDGINERLREEVFFVSLSPPIVGKTKVTRELD
jgi:hypothetical protein